MGYGDRYPVTAAGRGTAVVLMLGGIALFGVVTATLASSFTDQRRDDDHHGLEEMAERLGRIEAVLAALAATPPAPQPTLSDPARSEPAMAGSGE